VIEIKMTMAKETAAKKIKLEGAGDRASDGTSANKTS
jgi:hypothetical protein